MTGDGIELMSTAAIDVHGHCGVYGGYSPDLAKLLNAPAQEVSKRAAKCGIMLTVVSELGAFDAAEDQPADVQAANRRAVQAVEQYDNLRFYAAVNPRQSGWEQPTDELLAHPRCVGVKLHPRLHFWNIEDHGDRLFGFLHDRSALTLTHTGNLGNEPEKFIPWANQYANVKLILAHLGHDEVDDTRNRQVRAVKMSTKKNVWIDTSSSRSIISRLLEFAVNEIGADRILFGTDTPLYDAATQKARVAYAELSEDARRKILYGNAAALGLVSSG